MSTLTAIALASVCIGEFLTALTVRALLRRASALERRLADHEDYGARLFRLHQDGQVVMDLTVEDLVAMAKLKASPLESLTISGDGKILWQWHCHTPDKE